MEDKYEVKTNEYGTQYFKNKKRHRDNDLPAVEYNSGTKLWYIEDKIHRDNLPTVEHADGSKSWYVHGV